LIAKPFLGSLDKKGQVAYESLADARKCQQNCPSQYGNKWQYFDALNLSKLEGHLLDIIK
jgi:hypothetical protein